MCEGYTGNVVRRRKTEKMAISLPPFYTIYLIFILIKNYLSTSRET